MKSITEKLQESMVNEWKWTDISDLPLEDRILLQRHLVVAKDEHDLGYRMLKNKLGHYTTDMMNDMENELKEKFEDVDEVIISNSIHSILNIIALQILDGLTYKRALDLEIAKINNDQYMDLKEEVVDFIKDNNLGKSIKDYEFNPSNKYSGYGSRKDLEKTLAKLKA